MTFCRTQHVGSPVGAFLAALLHVPGKQLWDGRLAGLHPCLCARLPQGRLLEFPDEKHELYNAGNAGLAAFLGAVLEFFGLTAGYGKEETK